MRGARVQAVSLGALLMTAVLSAWAYSQQKATLPNWDWGYPAPLSREWKVSPHAKGDKFVHHEKAPYDPTKTSEGPAFQDPSGGDFEPLAPQLFRNWQGLVMDAEGWIPPDPILTVGSNHIIQAVNDDVRIFDKDGNHTGSFDANQFFGSPDKFFDPRVAYDPWRDRYLVVYLRIDDSTRRSFWALAVSKTNTPTANPADWWLYFIPVPDSHRLTHWIDFPYLGFDRDAVYLAGTLFSWDGSGESGISCLRMLNKDEIYFGLNWTSWSYVDLESGGTNDSHICPVQMWSEVNNPRTAYVVSTKISFNNTLTMRRITWSGGSWSQMWANGPFLSTEVVPVPAYARPPDISQPEGVQPLDNIDCRLMSAIFHNGVIYATQSVAYDWGSGNRAAIRLYRLTVGATSTAAFSVILGAEGWDYFYPVASFTREGDMIISFGRASSSTFAECRMTGWRQGQISPEPSSLVKAGEGTYYRVADGRNRWGDYFGAATDPWDQLTVWVVGQYARQNNTWGTWIAETNYKPLTLVEVTNVQGYAGLTVTLQATLRRADTNAPLPGETIRFSVRGTFVGTGLTDNNGVATYRYTIPTNIGAGQHTITAEFVRTPQYNGAIGTGVLSIEGRLFIWLGTCGNDNWHACCSRDLSCSVGTRRVWTNNWNEWPGCPPDYPNNQDCNYAPEYRLPGPGDQVLCGSNSTVTLTGNATVGSITAQGTLNLFGGSLTASTAAFTGTVNWTHGTLRLTDALLNGMMNISATGYKDLVGILTNRGTVVHSGERLRLINAETRLVNDTGAIYEFRSGWMEHSGRFVNRGVVRKTTGTAVGVGVPLDLEGGVIRVLEGRLDLGSGGAGVGGSGRLEIAEGATLRLTGGVFSWSGTNTTVGAGRLELHTTWEVPQEASFAVDLPSGGFHLLGGNLRPFGLFENRGLMVWPYGTVSGANLVNRGTLLIDSDSDKYLTGVVRNEAAVLHQAERFYISGSEARFFNEPSGIYEMRSGWVGGSGRFVNRGVVRKTTGTTCGIGVPVDLEGGTIQVQEGQLHLNNGGAGRGGMLQVTDGMVLRLGGGVFNWSGLYTGTSSGRVELHTTWQTPLGNTTEVNLQGSGLSFVAGAIEGRGSWVNRGPLYMETNATKWLLGTVVNQGQVVHAAEGVYLQNTESRFINEVEGVYEFRSGWLSYDSWGGGRPGRFVNRGVVRKTTGTTFGIGVPVDLEGGTIQVQEGQLHFGNGGSIRSGRFVFSQSGVARYTGGDFVIDGIIIGAGNGALELSGARFLTAEEQSATLNFTGDTFRFLSGTLHGRITNIGHFTLSGQSHRVLDGISLVNRGYILHSETGGTALYGGTVTNESSGVYEIQRGSLAVSAGAPLFINSGSLIKTSPADSDPTTATIGIFLTNYGTVEIRSGQLNITQIYNQLSGATLLNGGVLSVPTMHLKGGRLSGAGRVNGNVQNQGGVIAPGDGGQPVGVLTIDGSYTQDASGKYEVDIADANQYDRVEIVGNSRWITLNGHLVIRLSGSYAPPVGTRFTILRGTGSGSQRLGNFSQVQTIPPSLQVRLIYTQNSVEVEVTRLRVDGDVNNDGCVDDADLLAVLFAFGQAGSGLPEDVNGDEVVDDADLLMVLFNFGSGC